MNQHQEISKYSIRKLAKGAGVLLISSVLLFSAQNNASAAEHNGSNVNVKSATNAPVKTAQKKDTTNPEIQSIKMDKREYAPGEIAIATLIVKDESSLADVSIGFSNATQVGTPSLSGVADKANIEKVGDNLWKVTIQIYIPDKIGNTSYNFSAAIVDDAAENGTTIAPELAPTSLNTKDLSFKVVNKGASKVDTELPQFDSVTVDKQTYAPGDVIKAQLKISDKSKLSEVSVGFENYPDKGLIGLNKVADLSNVQRNSEGQWVVNVNIPIPSDLADGSYKFSHISATDEFGNAFGLIDVANFETKFNNVKFNVAKSVPDKSTVDPVKPQVKPQVNDQNKGSDIINTNTTDAKKPEDVSKQDNNVTPVPPKDNNANKADEKAPIDSDKAPQNKDAKDANAQKNNDAEINDKATDNTTEPKTSETPDQSNNNSKVAPQVEKPKVSTPNTADKVKPMDAPSQQNNAKQPSDEISTQKDTDKAQPQVKADTSNDNKVQTMPQDKNASNSTAKDVNKQAQAPNNKLADTKSPETKVDKQSNGENGQKGTNAKVKPQEQKEQPMQSQRKDSKTQQTPAKSQMQNKVTQGNTQAQSTTKQQPNHKMPAEMPKQGTTKVADNAKSNKTQQAANYKAVATQSQDKAKATDKNKKVATDKQKQTTAKDKANSKSKDAKSAKQLPKTGMMDTMRDYIFVGVLMAVGITIIMLRRFSAFK